jgi:hypothetical protein
LHDLLLIINYQLQGNYCKAHIKIYADRGRISVSEITCGCKILITNVGEAVTKENMGS